MGRGRQFDIIVVGAGPAGSVAARQAALLGCGSVLLLDQAQFPRPKTCAGGLSPRTCRALRELGLWAEVAAAGQTVHSVRLSGSPRRHIDFVGGPEGLVICRAQFDQILADAGVRAGVEFRPGVRADALLHEDERVVGVRTREGEYLGRWVIVAGGARSCLRWGPETAHLARSRIAWFEGARATPGRIEVIYDPDLLPGYGWVFPESEARVNVGVYAADTHAGPERVRRMLAVLTDRYLATRLAGARQLGPAKTHPICSALGIGHRTPLGLLLAGEANGLTNAATGEGVFYAVGSGALAARTLRQADQHGLNAAETGRLYRRRLWRAFGARLTYGRLLRGAGVRLVTALARMGDAAVTRRLAGALLAWA